MIFDQRIAHCRKGGIPFSIVFYLAITRFSVFEQLCLHKGIVVFFLSCVLFIYNITGWYLI
jgi:hypothetical protein